MARKVYLAGVSLTCSNSRSRQPTGSFFICHSSHDCPRDTNQALAVSFLVTHNSVAQPLHKILRTVPNDASGYQIRCIIVKSKVNLKLVSVRGDPPACFVPADPESRIRLQEPALLSPEL